jgi:hypothetical protein
VDGRFQANEKPPVTSQRGLRDVRDVGSRSDRAFAQRIAVMRVAGDHRSVLTARAALVSGLQHERSPGRSITTKRNAAIAGVALQRLARRKLVPGSMSRGAIMTKAPESEEDDAMARAAILADRMMQVLQNEGHRCSARLGFGDGRLFGGFCAGRGCASEPAGIHSCIRGSSAGYRRARPRPALAACSALLPV